MQKKIFRKNDEKSIHGTNGKGKIFFSEKRITIESQDGIIYYVFHTKAIGFIQGDLVEFIITRPSKDGKLAEAKPTKLLKRSSEELLMRVSLSHGKVEYRILESLGGGKVICEIAPKNIHDGDIFIVQFLGKAIVKILRYFGSEKDPRIMEEIIFFRAGVRLIWPENFEKLQIREAPKLPSTHSSITNNDHIPNTLKIATSQLFPQVSLSGRSRWDLRSWSTMTIDGADAKDLDDAISIARYDNGDFLLGVHIADVAEYVDESGDLDREAYIRGTSIYTPGRVIPMLPEILSNDRCSLHPGSPKLTLSILMRVDHVGNVKESFVTESVIESERKGIYDEVWEELQNEIEYTNYLAQSLSGVLGGNESKIKNQEGIGQYGVATPRPLVTFGHENTINSPLGEFYSLYKILEKRREKEGKILFETTECYFDLDEERNVKNIRKRERNEAHMMIEEFMVLANEEIAKWCAKNKIPFLSRVHEAPSTEKDREIREIIALSGNHQDTSFIEVKEVDTISGDITPHDIRNVLEQARKGNDLYRLSRLLLPKMAKAVYKDTVDRHFGLALKYYAHFTSPIRRYPDLLLHRMIKKYLHGELSREKSIYEKNMKKWGISLSEKERKAEEVSRAIDSLYMCRYMSDKVGQSFDGIVSGLTESNIYVELSSGVEGSIFLKGGNNTITKGGIILDSIRGALIDRKGKILYQIGENITVKIREVDMVGRRVEMEVGEVR